MLEEFLFSTEAASMGFVLMMSLIIVIGLQNTYVMRQGILGRHVFAAALTCIVCDYILIIFGSMGLGSFLSKNESLRLTAMVGGILFLLYYGAYSWLRAYRGKESSTALEGDPDVASLKRTIVVAMAFTFLNPLALLETTVIVGGNASKYTDFGDRVSYTMGAMAAETLWFLTLAFLSKQLRPLFVKPIAGRILDIFVGLLMFTIAAVIIYTEFV